MKTRIIILALSVISTAIAGCSGAGSATRSSYFGYHNAPPPPPVAAATAPVSEVPTTAPPTASTPTTVTTPVPSETGVYYDRERGIWRSYDTPVTSTTTVVRDSVEGDVTVINNYYSGGYTPVITPWWNTYYGGWYSSPSFSVQVSYSPSPWTSWRSCWIPRYYGYYYDGWSYWGDSWRYCHPWSYSSWACNWYSPWYGYDPYCGFGSSPRWSYYDHHWHRPWYSPYYRPAPAPPQPNTARHWGVRRADGQPVSGGTNGGVPVTNAGTGGGRQRGTASSDDPVVKSGGGGNPQTPKPTTYPSLTTEKANGHNDRLTPTVGTVSTTPVRPVPTVGTTTQNSPHTSTVQPSVGTPVTPKGSGKNTNTSLIPDGGNSQSPSSARVTPSPTTTPTTKATSLQEVSPAKSNTVEKVEKTVSVDKVSSTTPVATTNKSSAGATREADNSRIRFFEVANSQKESSPRSDAETADARNSSVKNTNTSPTTNSGTNQPVQRSASSQESTGTSSAPQQNRYTRSSETTSAPSSPTPSRSSTPSPWSGGGNSAPVQRSSPAPAQAPVSRPAPSPSINPAPSSTPQSSPQQGGGRHR